MVVSFKKTEGFVLFFVLIMMQIIFALSLTSLTNRVYHLKSIKNLVQRDQQDRQTATLMNVLANQILHIKEHCQIETMSASQLIKQSSQWWDLYSCAGIFNKNRYHYVVEFLGHDACAVSLFHPKWTMDYYRVTLMVSPTRVERKLFMQSTVAVNSNKQLACNDFIHLVVPGVQMKRELNEFNNPPI